MRLRATEKPLTLAFGGFDAARLSAAPRRPRGCPTPPDGKPGFVGAPDRGYVAAMPFRLVLAASTAALLLTACSVRDDKEARRRAAGPAPSAAALLRVASPAAGEKVFGQCFACHSIDRSAADRSGPNLFGVMGAEVAQRRPRFPYTSALQSFGGRWTPARMDAWLTNPKRLVPGTAMGFAGLADPLDRADLIAYLQTQH